MPPSTALVTQDPGGAEARAQAKAVQTLVRLMEEIAEVRAQVLRRQSAGNELQDRLQKELVPLEEQLVRTRLETFRVLGRHLREGLLRRKSAGLLRNALRGLADELELDYGLDLKDERRIYLGEDVEEGTVVPARRVRDAEDGDAFSRTEEGGPMGWEDGPSGHASGPRRRGKNQAAGEGAKEGRAGRARPDSKAARKREEKDQALAGDIRALYLLLARALHPDKEPNPAMREAKTTWMQKVTTAYANKDLAMLLDILVRNPLEAVGPYLSQAPLKTVQGFAKRLRRELAALKRQAEKAEDWMHPFFARFLRNGSVDEAAVARHLGEMRRAVKLAKQRLTIYRTLEGAEELAAGLQKYDWRDLI